MQWTMFQMGHIGPMLGQAHHFLGYAPEKIEYAMNRYKNEANRLYGVVEKRLRESKYVACNEYTIADMATVPWLRAPERQGVNIDEYPTLKRWRDAILERPAVKRAVQVLADRRRTQMTDQQRRISSVPNSMLNGKVAWITGGGSGIGLAGGIELARAGAHVVISGRSAETLKKAEKEIKAAGSGEAISLDVADQKEVARAAQAILKRHGRIDILINSAGINNPRRSFRNVSVEAWDQIVAINLSGMFYCCHAVLPGDAREEGGADHQHLLLGGALREHADRAGLQRDQARGGRAHRVDQHGGVRERHPRHLDPAGRGGDADPREAPGAAAAGRARAHAAGRGPRPARSCSSPRSPPAPA